MKPLLDVLVVGEGIAGMTFATQLVDRAGDRPMRVRILSKAPVRVSNSFEAQGGVAAVMRPDDSFEQHVEDTLTVGAGRNDPAVVRLVVEQGPALVRGLVDLGARFDADAKGQLDLAREGGHSAARVVHHQDRTGEEIVRVLHERVERSTAIEVLDSWRAIDLLLEGEGEGRRCVGVSAMYLRTGDVVELRASAVLLATGGAGQIYKHTTNPASATGDGVAMAIRAGVPLRDMAFVQFHPTALVATDAGPTFLVSEAVRGAGARLLRADGSALMEHEHPKGDLAPRNVVARVIHREMQQNDVPNVWLDASAIGAQRFAAEFPAIDRRCRGMGLVPGLDPIPVAPAAHYFCGGIRTDDRGRTELAGLYAVGECASSGLHGADRLASNSLLEALVIPTRAVEAVLVDCADFVGAPMLTTRSNWLSSRNPPNMKRALETLRHTMSTHVAIVRERQGLAQALRLIARLERCLGRSWSRHRWSKDLIDLRDMLAVARAVTEAAIAEPESIGAHYLED